MFVPVLSKAYQKRLKGWELVASEKVSDLPIYYVCVYRSHDIGVTSGRAVMVPVYRSVVVKYPRYSTKSDLVTPAVYLSPTCYTFADAISKGKREVL